MERLAHLNRPIRINDWNTMVDIVNHLLDTAEQPTQMVTVNITRKVRNYDFFNWEEVQLPYHYNVVVGRRFEVVPLTFKFKLEEKEVKEISEKIEEGYLVSVNVDVTEDTTKEEEYQDEIKVTKEKKVFITKTKKKDGSKSTSKGKSGRAKSSRKKV